MKDLSRAYNRHKQEVKFKKRVKNWFARPLGNRAEELKKALTGNGYTFLRTTGRPCNCESCTYLKYKRTPNHEIIKNDLDCI